MNNAPQSAEKKEIFLNKGDYQQRRLRDAVRMLPILGVILWFLPLLAGEGSTTSRIGLFIFGVWILLIILSGSIVRRLSLYTRTTTKMPSVKEAE